jgi:hypothetical protein
MTSHLPGGKPGTCREGSDGRRGTGLRFKGETVISVSSASSGPGPPCLVSGPVRLTDVDGRDIAPPFERFGDLNETGALGRVVTKSEALKAI